MPGHTGHPIVVIGGSAGAVQAVTDIARGLPADLPAAVFVVIHTSPTGPGILSRIIDRAGPLPAQVARDGEPIRRGRIYVAPPDHHLLLLDRQIRVTRGPKENGFRPAVDPLFRTAARAHGSRVIGIVLSGGLDDGTEGLSIIKENHGIAIVQEPDEAVFPSMPQSAIQNVAVDHVARIADIAPLIVQSVNTPARGDTVTKRNGTKAAALDVAIHGTSALKDRLMGGPPSAFTCPECGGAVWETKEGNLLRYRCHVGHSYTPDGLIIAQTQDLEAALWSALRALEEAAGLRRRSAVRARGGGLPGVAEAYESQAGTAEKQADAIRAVLMGDRGNGAFAPPVQVEEPHADNGSNGDNGDNGAGGSAKKSRRQRSRKSRPAGSRPKPNVGNQRAIKGAVEFRGQG